MNIVNLSYREISDYRSNYHSSLLDNLWKDLVATLPEVVQKEISELVRSVEIPYELTPAIEHDDKHSINQIPLKFCFNRNIKSYLKEKLEPYLDSLLILAVWE